MVGEKEEHALLIKISTWHDNTACFSQHEVFIAKNILSLHYLEKKKSGSQVICVRYLL